MRIEVQQIWQGLPLNKKNLDTLIMLNNINFPFEQFTVANACGHLDIIKYIHYNMPKKTAEQQPMCSDLATLWAAGNRHLEVLRWLYENGAEICCKGWVSGNCEIPPQHSSTQYNICDGLGSYEWAF